MHAELGLIIKQDDDPVFIAPFGDGATGITYRPSPIGVRVWREPESLSRNANEVHVASFSKGIPVTQARSLTIAWDGAFGRESQRLAWPPPS